MTPPLKTIGAAAMAVRTAIVLFVFVVVCLLYTSRCV